MLIATWLFAIQLAAPSDAFDVRRAVNDPCVMNTFGQLLKRGGGILGRVEAAAFLVQESDGSLTMVFWPENGVSRKAKFHGAIPQGTVAIVHTHPPEMERPSRGDLAEAKRLVQRQPQCQAEPGLVRPGFAAGSARERQRKLHR